MATGRRAEKKEETKGIQGKEKSVTESLAGRKEKQRRVGETERKGRKAKRREEKSEDEGDGKSKVKPVTEWAGMTDWVVAGRKWMKRWEVTKTRVAFWIKKYSFC